MSLIKKYLVPDYYLDDIYSITPDFLSKLGISALILDIDNTLVTYDDLLPTEPVLGWLRGLENEGIKISFISNNNEERVSHFNRDLGYFYKSKSKKPSRKMLVMALDNMQSDSKSTAAIGDQIFTDIFAAKRLGLTAILVKPIKDKESSFFRFKRFFERIIIRKYFKIS